MKNLKILMTNHALNLLSGSELWVYTMAKEFVRCGHEVTIYTNVLGDQKVLVDRLKKFVTVTTDIPNQDKFDVAICNHTSTTRAVKKLTCPKIRTCHSLCIELEFFEPGFDHYVSVSGDIQDMQKKAGFDSVVIPNCIDCSRFAPKYPISIFPKRAFIFALPKDPGYKVLMEACESFGLSVVVRDGMVWNMEDYINSADIVLSIDRVMLEAMACGRAVINIDQRWWQKSLSGSGYLDPKDWDDKKPGYFRAKKYCRTFMIEDVQNELKKYLREHGTLLREKVLKDYNVVVNARKYLQLIEKDL